MKSLKKAAAAAAVVTAAIATMLTAQGHQTVTHQAAHTVIGCPVVGVGNGAASDC